MLLRVHAVCMLEHMGEHVVLRDDPSPLTRHEAAFTLGQLGHKSAVSALVAAMLTQVPSYDMNLQLHSDRLLTMWLSQLEKAIQDKDESNSALIAWAYLSYLRRNQQGTEDLTKPKIRL